MEEREELLEVARKAARSASKDPHVVEEAAREAVWKLADYGEAVVDETAWVRVVARNHARRIGAKQAKQVPFGRAGSKPPAMADERLDRWVGGLIAEMHGAGAASLGSLVAAKVDFEQRWQMLGGDTRALLHAKYVEGWSSKEIAARLGLAPGTVDNRLWKARGAAAAVFADLDDDGAE